MLNPEPSRMRNSAVKSVAFELINFNFHVFVSSSFLHATAVCVGSQVFATLRCINNNQSTELAWLSCFWICAAEIVKRKSLVHSSSASIHNHPQPTSITSNWLNPIKRHIIKYRSTHTHNPNVILTSCERIRASSVRYQSYCRIRS